MGAKVPNSTSDSRSGTSSLLKGSGGEDNDIMSMYVELLSSVLNDSLDDLSSDALVKHALVCRAEMLASRPYKGASAYSTLAAEVAYDRALLTLCTVKKINVVAADFSHPAEVRHRLELELESAGIDLIALARERIRT